MHSTYLNAHTRAKKICKKQKKYDDLDAVVVWRSFCTAIGAFEKIIEKTRALSVASSVY